MYNGTVEDLPRIFASLNHPIPQLSNPADYIVLLAQTIEKDEDLPRYNIDDEVNAEAQFLQDKSDKPEETLAHTIAEDRPVQYFTCFLNLILT